ncbi:hypothetical protein BJ912DRAFT_1046034 [Pholiota molesta]|nr:hypothetical protein BJ912DRAFT_1046034 [Pholiota molesta]
MAVDERERSQIQVGRLSAAPEGLVPRRRQDGCRKDAHGYGDSYRGRLGATALHTHCDSRGGMIMNGLCVLELGIQRRAGPRVRPRARVSNDICTGFQRVIGGIVNDGTRREDARGVCVAHRRPLFEFKKYIGTRGTAGGTPKKLKLASRYLHETDSPICVQSGCALPPIAVWEAARERTWPRVEEDGQRKLLPKLVRWSDIEMGLTLPRGRARDADLFEREDAHRVFVRSKLEGAVIISAEKGILGVWLESGVGGFGGGCGVFGVLYYGRGGMGIVQAQLGHWKTGGRRRRSAVELVEPEDTLCARPSASGRVKSASA